mmetsp:Transcript_8797/g.18599  ORF Transcript_8797/g.18599 Transcript_8797/m.18599 type:complete len:201 (+) Transcript_8797:524-1126(+)
MRSRPSLAAVNAAARAVPPPPKIRAYCFPPPSFFPLATSSPTNRCSGLYIPFQSVLSPISTLVPFLSFFTMTVFTLPISLAASVNTSKCGIMFCLWGIVTEHPPKSSSFQIGPSTNSSTVSTSHRVYVCGNFTAANADPCISGLTLYAMLCPSIPYRCTASRFISSFPAMISAAVSWPGAATEGRHSCVTGVNRGLSMRE